MSNDPTTEIQQFTVPDDRAGERLDAYLAAHFRDRSRVALRNAIMAGLVQVGGKQAKPAYRLRGGEQVQIRLPDLPVDRPRPENIPLEILFEDEHLAVVNKPAGMVVHPAKGHWSGTLVAGLQFHFDELSEIGGAARPGIVHRLDRDTTGVLLVAKTDQAHLKLSQQFHDREVQKEYSAIVVGTSDRDADVIREPIGIHPYHRDKMAIRREHESVRPAETFYEVATRWKGFSLLKVFPKTGRTHQIRVHLAHVGMPVLCDRLYGGRARITKAELWRIATGRTVPPPAENWGVAGTDEIILGRQALHAYRLKIAHPITGEPMEFTAPWPDDFQRVVGELHAACPAVAASPGVAPARWGGRPAP